VEFLSERRDEENNCVIFEVEMDEEEASVLFAHGLNLFIKKEFPEKSVVAYPCLEKNADLLKTEDIRKEEIGDDVYKELINLAVADILSKVIEEDKKL